MHTNPADGKKYRLELNITDLRVRNLYLTIKMDSRLDPSNMLPVHLLLLLAALGYPCITSILTQPFNSWGRGFWRIKAVGIQQLSRILKKLKTEAKPTEAVMEKMLLA
jgi:hypothetical protein